MQNMYVGDIGDYGKYGLLRALFPASENHKLGLVWYLVPDEIHKTDGKHIAYLSKANYSQFDGTLFNALRGIVDSDNRHVDGIEESNIFNEHVVYFKKALTFDGISANSPLGRKKRLTIRDDWFEEALRVTQDCDAVFLDPDNGIETSSVPKHAKTGPKYAYLDEIEQFSNRRQVVVVYHHLGRNGSHESQIKERIDQLQSRLGANRHVLALRFRPYSPRAYFIICTKLNKTYVDSRLQCFLESAWKECFELLK